LSPPSAHGPRPPPRRVPQGRNGAFTVIVPVASSCTSLSPDRLRAIAELEPSASATRIAIVDHDNTVTLARVLPGIATAADVLRSADR